MAFDLFNVVVGVPDGSQTWRDEIKLKQYAGH